MIEDFKWTSRGGLLLDGSGDIAITDPDGADSLISMVRTRVKAELRAWKLYAIGADLQNRVGDLMGPELEIAIQRQIARALTADNLLSRGSFQVETLPDGNLMHVFIYVGQKLITSLVLNPQDAGASLTLSTNSTGTAVPSVAVPGFAAPGLL